MNEDNFEKKLTKILMIIGTIAIVIVILVYFPWGGDKAKIAKEYEYLDNTHVYEYITMDEIKSKIDSGETFHLYLGSNKLSKVNYFVYYVNELAEEYKVEKVYYLNYSKLSQDDLTYLQQKSTPELKVSTPTMIYFKKNEIEGISKAYDISCIRNFSADYESNYWLLLKDYFRYCYSD